MNELIYPEESYAIMGACFAVYNDMGCGFLEPIYHECMEIELAIRKISFVHEPSLNLTYKGVGLKHTYSPDFTCWNKIVLELKSCDKITEDHVAQVLNYLSASGYKLGLLVNFGHFPKVEYRRIANTRSDSRPFA